MKVTAIVFLAMLLLNVRVNAQSGEEIQKQIVSHLDGINKWDTSNSYNKFDSLEGANKSLLQYLQKVCTNNPSLLNADINLLENSRMYITTTIDRKMRAYCWDTWEGGTMRAYNGLIQYNSGNGTKVKVLNDVSVRDEEHGRFDYGSFCDTIYSIKRKDNAVIYIVVSSAVVSSAMIAHMAKAYAIENGDLNDSIGFFQTSKKLLNSMSYFCDLSSSVNSEKTGCPEIKLSSDKQKIYIPVIKKDDEITDKYLVYKFDGYKFVYDKNAK